MAGWLTSRSSGRRRSLTLILRAQADRLRDENALEAYWLALAAHLREVLGLPVLVHDVEVSIAEQYRRLTNAPPEDPLVGRDLLVRVDIDEHLVVAVTWREGMWMSGIARGTDPSEFVLIGAGLTELCRDPQVVAGALPRGAARARVQDRQDVWHEATVGRSAWLCVLPQRSRGGVNPPLEFLDTKGAPVELGEDAWGFGQPPDLRPHEAAVRAGALVPAIWFAADHGIPIFEGWDGPCDRATALYFVFGGWNVKISTQSTTAAEVFQQRLTRVPYDTVDVRRRMRDITLAPLEGTLDEDPITLEVAALKERWGPVGGWVAVTRMTRSPSLYRAMAPHPTAWIFRVGDRGVRVLLPKSQRR